MTFDAESALQNDMAHHLHPYTNPVSLRDRGPEMVTHGEGVYLFTPDGRRVIDMGSGLSNVSLGYGHPRLCDAADRAMRQLSFGHTAHRRSHPWVAELSERLNAVTPDQYRRFLFGSTGSEGIESAIKLALWYWRLRGRPSKRAILGRELSYHGNTLFAGGLTGIGIYHEQFGLPISDLIHHVESPYWYRFGNGRSVEEFTSDVIRALEERILEIGPENIAALVGDAIQTGGGNIIPPIGYWPAVRQLCDRYDILIIADEVITGFGKTGTMFAFEQFGFEPDLFVMAKGITSGYFPLSAIAIGERLDEEISSADEIFAHVFTNAGHPVGAAVAVAALDVLAEERLLDRVVTDIGPTLRGALDDIRAELPFVIETRSIGVIGALEVGAIDGEGEMTPMEVSAFLERVIDIAWDRGAAMRGSGIFLPLTITDAEMDEALGILRDSLIQAWETR